MELIFKEMVSIAISGLLAILLADIMSGLVHWAEDAYAREDMPLIGKWIAKANIEHHVRPRAFLKKTYWQSSLDLWAVSIVVLIYYAHRHQLTWPIWLFAVISAQTPVEKGWLVTRLQKMYVIQHPRHHSKHHQNKKDTHYCAVTNMLNPILDGLKFWKIIEKCLEVVGIKRRNEYTPISS
jgi:plasmanylethanolamine desaturase